MPVFAPSTIISSNVTLTFLQTANSVTGASSYTFTAQNTGTAATDRVIIVGVAAAQGTVGLPTSVTVAGLTATVLKTQAGTNSFVSLYSVSVPTGTTGDVVVTLSAAAVRCEISLWRSVGNMGIQAYGSASTTTSGGNMLVPVPSGGEVIGMAYNINASNQTFTWVGVTKDFDINVGTTPNIDTVSGARVLSATDQILTCTATPSLAASSYCACVASIS